MTPGRRSAVVTTIAAATMTAVVIPTGCFRAVVENRRDSSPSDPSGTSPARERRRVTRAELGEAHVSQVSRWRSAPTTCCRRCSPVARARSTGRQRGVGRWTRRNASKYSRRSRARARLKSGRKRARRDPQVCRNLVGTITHRVARPQQGTVARRNPVQRGDQRGLLLGAQNDVLRLVGFVEIDELMNES